MARDEEFHELATRFPEAALLLAGLPAKGGYRARSIELKSSSRRVDVVLEPLGEGDPVVLLEWQRRRDQRIEQNLLKKVVDYCAENDRYEPTCSSM